MHISNVVPLGTAPPTGTTTSALEGQREATEEAEPGGAEQPPLEASSTWRVTISDGESTCGP